MKTSDLMNFLAKGPQPTYTLPNGGGDYTTANSTAPFSPGSSIAPLPISPAKLANPTSVLSATSSPVVDQPQTPQTPQAPVSSPFSTSSSISSPVSGGVASYGGSSGSYNPREDYINLMMERAQHASAGTGLYAVDPSMGYSPEQIQNIRAGADQIYDKELGKLASAVTSAKSDPDAPVLDMSKASPYATDALDFIQKSGGTAAERQAATQRMLNMTEDQQKEYARNLVYRSMTTGKQQAFDMADNAVQVAANLVNTAPEDFSTNPLKYQKDKFINLIGGKGSQQYQTFEAMLGQLTAPIINNIYGAAVTGGELDRARTFIPDLGADSTQRVVTKLRVLAAMNEYGNDALLARQLPSMPKPKLDDYLTKYGIDPKTKEISSLTGGTKSNKSATYAEEW